MMPKSDAILFYTFHTFFTFHAFGCHSRTRGNPYCLDLAVLDKYPYNTAVVQAFCLRPVPIPEDGPIL